MVLFWVGWYGRVGGWSMCTTQSAFFAKLIFNGRKAAKKTNPELRTFFHDLETAPLKPALLFQKSVPPKTAYSSVNINSEEVRLTYVRAFFILNKSPALSYNHCSGGTRPNSLGWVVQVEWVWVRRRRRMGLEKIRGVGF